MKFFDYWTELPLVLSEMLPSTHAEVIQNARSLSAASKRITFIQSEIA